MRPRKTVAVVLAAMSVIVSFHAALAEWVPEGTPVCVFTGDQRHVVMAPDGVGGAYIAWDDTRDDYDVFVQHLDRQGMPLWETNGKRVYDSGDDQTRPAVTADGAGGVIIAWSDKRNGNDGDLYVQRYDASGSALWTAGGVPVKTDNWGNSYIDIISDGAEGAFLAWQYSGGSGTYPNDIYAQHVNSMGASQWTAGGVGVCTLSWNQFDPWVVTDGAGGVIINWEDRRDMGVRQYAQRVSSGGVPMWATDGIALADTASGQGWACMVSDGEGGAIVAWHDDRDAYDIYAQRVDGGGNLLWDPAGLAIHDRPWYQMFPRMIAVSGGAIVIWEDSRDNNGDIYAARLNNDGTLPWGGDGMVVCNEPDQHQDPVIAPDGSGGAVIAWYELRTSDADIFAQRIDGDGIRQWTASGVLICTSQSQEKWPNIVGDGGGGAILAWEDMRNYAANDYYDVFAGGVDADGGGKVPVALASFEAAAGADGVTLRWVLSGAGTSPRFSVFRKSEGAAEYAAVARHASLGDGPSYEYTDSRCGVGRYVYRVDVSDSGEVGVLFETGVLVVPSRAPVLEQNRPNPFNPSTTIRFYLPEQRPVSVVVYDPKGRLVATIADGVMPAGWNTVEWRAVDAGGEPLCAGVYFCKLTAGKLSRTRKMVILH